MTQIAQVNPNELVRRIAAELKKQNLVSPPEWSQFVKTGHHKDRLPDQPDWWYYRSAAILRTVAKLNLIGTQKLRVKFGGRKNRGYLPEHFYPASGSIIRKVLQQLEKSGLLKQAQKGAHKGRTLTPQGDSFLTKITMQMLKEEQKAKE